MNSLFQKKITEFLSKAKKPIVVILGTTASGKTSLGVELAKKFQGEVISADSRQLYKYFSIGTNKVTPEEMKGIPHHLVDCMEPGTPFTAYDFQQHAQKKIEEIRSRNNLPFFVGGTMLYLDAIVKGLVFPDGTLDPAYRKELERLSSEILIEKLQQVDPESAKSIDPQNRVYIIRAIEIARVKGTKAAGTKQCPTDDEFLLLGIERSREELYDRINTRVEQMWKTGFIDEVRTLDRLGFLENNQVSASHGYPEALQFLEGELSEEEAKEKMKQNTRKYAKRQLTWWRKNPEITWITF